MNNQGITTLSMPDYQKEIGATEKNPFGQEGIFSSVFGVDPKNIDYTNLLSETQLGNVAQAKYDIYENPFLDIENQTDETGARKLKPFIDTGTLTSQGIVQRVPRQMSGSEMIARGIGSQFPMIGPFLGFFDTTEPRIREDIKEFNLTNQNQGIVSTILDPAVKSLTGVPLPTVKDKIEDLKVRLVNIINPPK